MNDSKKQKPKIFTVSTLCPIFFLVVVLCLWIASRQNQILWTGHATPEHFTSRVELDNGTVKIWWVTWEQKTANPPVNESDTGSIYPSHPPSIDLVLFKLDRMPIISYPPDQTMITSYTEHMGSTLRIRIPGLFLLAFVWLTVSVFRNFRARKEFIRRWRHSLCMKCGYDLRESPDRCPECGLEIEPAVAKS